MKSSDTLLTKIVITNFILAQMVPVYGTSFTSCPRFTFHRSSLTMFASSYSYYSIGVIFVLHGLSDCLTFPCSFSFILSPFSLSIGDRDHVRSVKLLRRSGEFLSAYPSSWRREGRAPCSAKSKYKTQNFPTGITPTHIDCGTNVYRTRFTYFLSSDCCPFSSAVAEVLSARNRSFCSLFTSGGWTTGLLTLSGIAWLIRDWMHLQVAITISILVFCVILPYVIAPFFIKTFT